MCDGPRRRVTWPGDEQPLVPVLPLSCVSRSLIFFIYEMGRNDLYWLSVHLGSSKVLLENVL